MSSLFIASLYCWDCNVLCINQYTFDSHLNGQKHHFITSKQTRICTVCDVAIAGGTVVWTQHVEGARHTRKMGTVTKKKKDLYCNVCRKSPTKPHRGGHFTSEDHHSKQKLAALASAYLEAEKDKFSVTVTSEALDFGIMESSIAATRPSRELIIKTTVGSIRLLSCKLTSSTSARQSSYEIDTAVPVDLVPSTPLAVPVRFNYQSSPGYFSDTIELVFESTAHGQQFVIVRGISARVGNPADYETLRPTAPYVRLPRKSRSSHREIGRVLRPSPRESRNTIPYTVELLGYDIPEREIVTIGTLEKRIEKVQTVIPGQLTAESYKKHWQTLIWVDEEQMRQDLEAYDMENVTLEFEGQYYFLNIPGLAEKRPSVLRGDNIEIRLEGRSGVVYEGRVEEVQDIRVGMTFHKDFHQNWNPAMLCEVRFTMNRIPFRRMHQALDVPFFPSRIMFPRLTDVAGIARPTEDQINQTQLYNALLAGNCPQMEAIAAIVNQPPGSAPFIIFGPPGTGKTVTVVEAILQILRKDSQARIFACAPSNPAADLIALRLIKSGITSDKLFRLNAPSRFHNSLPAYLKPYTYRDRNGHFSVTSREELESFEIVVSTCGSASIPHGIGMKAGHFTHIVIDEAGQALEPECMIPIKTMGGPSTNLILAGDPKQLGPIIRSEVARPFGYAMSYLERLMNSDVYDEVKGHGISVVKLTKNWRNHEAILRFPNEEFYKGDLEVCGPNDTTDCLIGSPVLANPSFPLVFQNVAGQDAQEAGSPSYFNIAEVSEVESYIKKLLEDQTRCIRPEDICVISPYNAQAKKLRKSLKESYGRVKVGSVEMCQGEEYKVVIITTVRTERQQVPFDLKHVLGFLVNPRRINVAMTRAQALLVIVGDPRVLSLDPLWRRLLNYIYVNGGWKGIEPDWDTLHDDGSDDNASQHIRRKGEEWESEMDAMAKRLSAVVISKINSGVDGTLDYLDEVLETRDDRAWPARDDED